MAAITSLTERDLHPDAPPHSRTLLPVQRSLDYVVPAFFVGQSGDPLNLIIATRGS